MADSNVKALLFVATAVLIAATCLLLVGRPSERGSARLNKGHGDALVLQVQAPRTPSLSQASNNRTITTDTSSSDSHDLLPVEWEEPFFAIMMNTNQDMRARNAQLIDLATKAAANVPQVQQECLKHLAFGLSNDDTQPFVELITAPTIPEHQRIEFLNTVLDMRPTSLIVPLCEQVARSGFPHLREIALGYLRDYAIQQAAP